MTTGAAALRLDVEGIRSLRFAYDAEYDIALLHVGEPRPAVTFDLGGGWHLRVNDDDEVVGMELHGWRRFFLDAPSRASAVAPAMREVEAFTGRTLHEDIEAAAAVERLPRTARLLIDMAGEAIARYETEYGGTRMPLRSEA